jgi:hypothetical protein
MSSLDIRKIGKQNWDLKTFNSWLKSADPKAEENDYFDLKEVFYSTGRECRKDFSSFANCNGGFIIFGVEDETKKILGVEKFDIHTQIENCLAPNCLNPELRWEIVKQYLINKNKSTIVYVAKIYKTRPFWKRPHISDGVIYLRKKGKSERIKTLTDLREKFFQKNDFIPEDIIYFDEVQKSFKTSNYSVDVLDVFIVRLWTGMKLYLSESELDKKDKDREELLEMHRELSNYIEEIKRKKSEISTVTGLPDSFDTENKELEKLYKIVASKLLIYKNKFSKYLKKQYE